MMCLDYYLFYFDFCELLAVTVLLLEVLAALLVEYDNFVTLYERCLYFGNDLGSFYGGSAYGDCAFVVNKKHVFELYFLSGLYSREVVNKHYLVCLYLELLALNLNNSVHYFNLFFDASVRRDSS